MGGSVIIVLSYYIVISCTLPYDVISCTCVMFMYWPPYVICFAYVSFVLVYSCMPRGPALMRFFCTPLLCSVFNLMFCACLSVDIEVDVQALRSLLPICQISELYSLSSYD